MSESTWYTVFLRSSTLTLLGQFTRVLLVDINRRFNNFSNAWIEVEVGDPLLNSITGLTGIIIQRDESIVLTGIIRGVKDAYEAELHKVIISVSCDLLWLFGRLAYPVVTGPPYSASAHDVRTDCFETVAKELVYYNAGAGATTARIISALTIETDASRGDTVTSRARFHNLLVLLNALARDAIGFRMINMQFQVYTITDLSTTAMFSIERGNVARYTYDIARPESNYVIAGGGGEGTARVFAEDDDAASITAYGRIEKFRDARDTSDAGELAQRIAETLSEDAIKYRITFTPVETEHLKFIADYDLGDKIMFTRSGVNYIVPIKLIRLTWDAVTEKIATSISIGTMSEDADVENRLSKLESTV